MANMTVSLADRLRDFAHPAFRAQPIAPYALNSVVRWSLLAVFLGYVAAGRFTEEGLTTAAALIVVPLRLVASELIFLKVPARRPGPH